MIGGYIMRKKYFFFDVDGTLTCGPHDRRIVPETFEALDRLRENGHFVCIATGRAFSMAKFAMQQTGITNMVCDGGNGICLDGELVSISPMDRDKCLTLLDELEKKDLPYAVVEGDSLDYYAKDDRFMTCEGSTEGDMKGHIDPNFDYHTIQNFHKIFVALREEEEHLLENINILPFMRYPFSFPLISSSLLTISCIRALIESLSCLCVKHFIKKDICRSTQSATSSRHIFSSKRKIIKR